MDFSLHSGDFAVPALHGLTCEDASVRELKKARIRQEILAQEADEDRRLREEVRREIESERQMAARMLEVQCLGLLPPVASLKSNWFIGELPPSEIELQRLGPVAPMATVHPMLHPDEARVGEKLRLQETYLESGLAERLHEWQSLGLVGHTPGIHHVPHPTEAGARVEEELPLHGTELQHDMAERLQEVQSLGLLPLTTTIQTLLNSSDRPRLPLSVPPPLSHRTEAELADKPRKLPGSESPTNIDQQAPGKIDAINSKCFQCGQSNHRCADCHVPRETCHILKRKAEGDPNVLRKKMIMQKAGANGEAPRKLRGQCYGCGKWGHRISECHLSTKEINVKTTHRFIGKCYRCGEEGHLISECRVLKHKTTGKTPHGFTGKCYRCGEEGHRISECRLLKQEPNGKAPHGFTGKCYRYGVEGHPIVECRLPKQETNDNLLHIFADK